MAVVGSRQPSTALDAPAGDAELSLGEIPAEDVLATLHFAGSQYDAQEGDESDVEADESDAAWRLARSTGRLYGALYDDEGDGAEEEDDDDADDDGDDDVVQHSWSAENTSQDVISHSEARDDDEEAYEEEDEEDEGEELLALQFRSDFAVQWSTVESTVSTQASSERVEESVRAALSILNTRGPRESHDNSDSDDGDSDSDSSADKEHEEASDGHTNDWAVDYGVDGKPYYYDIVHEAMEARWPPTADERQAGGDAKTTDDGDHGGRDGNDAIGTISDRDDSDRDDDEEEAKNGDNDRDDGEAAERLQLHTSRASDSHETRMQQQQQQAFQRSNFTLSNFSTLTDGGDDEWQEAYTAKGRVYYYNRRTRESSWRKPDNFVSRQSTPQKQLGFASSFSSSQGVDSGHQQHHSGSFYSSSASVGRAATSVGVVVAPETQDFLFCSFCGQRTVGADAARSHLRECSAHRYHRDNRTELHRHFEQLLIVLAEDTTLRSLHYASSFPDATALSISPVALVSYRDRASASTSSPRRRSQASVRDSLFLLRRHHGSTTCSTKPNRDDKHTQEDDKPDRKPRDERAAGTGRVRLERKSSTASAQSTDSAASTRRRKTSAGSASDATSSHSGVSSSAPRPRPSTGLSPLESETCRYCGRSFAEGRLAKHEAVCPRVFGTEGSWGRGVSQPTTPRASASPFATAARRKPKSAPLEKRNLALSFKEYQATLVRCPVCERTFAPSGAQQHIDICKSVQNRPRNPIRATNFAVAG